MMEAVVVMKVVVVVLVGREVLGLLTMVAALLVAQSFDWKK